MDLLEAKIEVYNSFIDLYLSSFSSSLKKVDKNIVSKLFVIKGILFLVGSSKVISGFMEFLNISINVAPGKGSEEVINSFVAVISAMREDLGCSYLHGDVLKSILVKG